MSFNSKTLYRFSAAGRAVRYAVSLLLLAISCNSDALDARVRLQDYHHKIWNDVDGAPAGIGSMAQTTDGWIWLGTSVGLYRFDGVRFERFTAAAGGEPLNPNISELVALPDGNLYIGYIGGGLSVRHPDDTVEHLAAFGENGPISSTYTLAADTDGALWVANKIGLFHLAGGVWRRIGAEQGFPAKTATNVLLDQNSRLWASDGEQLYRLNRNDNRFFPVGVKGKSYSLIESPDGRLWSGDDAGFQLVPLDANDPQRARHPRFNQTEGHGFGLFDADGNLWALEFPSGIRLVAGAGRMVTPRIVPSIVATDKFDQHWQMSSLSTNLIMEDVEGNIWIATKAGLERFRNNRATRVVVPDINNIFSLVSDERGVIWTVDQNAEVAWYMAPGQAPRADRAGSYTYVARAYDGGIWLANERFLEHRYRGKKRLIPLPVAGDDAGKRFHRYTVFDDGVVLWVITRDGTVFCWAEGKWREEKNFGWPVKANRRTVGAPGLSWFGMYDGSLVNIDNGKVTKYSAAQVGDIGTITDLQLAPELLIAGQKGMVVLCDGKFRPLVSDLPEALLYVTGMLTTANGDHWFNGRHGIVHVSKASWDRALLHPEQPLQYELIDGLEGYPGHASTISRVSTATEGAGGLLWFVSTDGLVTLDPSKAYRSLAAPRVEIRGIRTELRYLPASTRLRLPAGTSKIDIEYTALSFRKPERTRFRYRLAGIDRDWHYADTQRSAHYGNLPPGHYVFRVTASDEAGNWPTVEQSIEFHIEPTATQTTWFKILCLLAAVMLLWLLYRWRISRVTKRLGLILEERRSERERIARELHDTLLQSVQGLVLRVHAAALRVPANAHVRFTLDSIVEQGNDAILEGRERVRDLRAGSTDGPTLVEQLRQVAAEQAFGTATFTALCSGQVMEIHPVVQEELLAIGREAVLNAYAHSGASAIEVEQSFEERNLKLIIRDNGRGIDPRFAHAGSREGHWGMISMAERADKIRAELILSEPDKGGTIWTVVVPGAIAYVAPQRPPRWRILRWS
ncbi:MAG: hypothetical protein K2X55_06780 [Burkholderiaceae bacterium]|nr:hypothetical protein [Burkholderiaceae bacterium]